MGLNKEMLIWSVPKQKRRKVRTLPVVVVPPSLVTHTSTRLLMDAHHGFEAPACPSSCVTPAVCQTYSPIDSGVQQQRAPSYRTPSRPKNASERSYIHLNAFFGYLLRLGLASIPPKTMQERNQTKPKPKNGTKLTTARTYCQAPVVANIEGSAIRRRGRREQYLLHDPG